MNILSKIIQRWKRYRNINDKKKEVQPEWKKDEEREKRNTSFRLAAEKDTIHTAVNNLNLDRFQYKVVCAEASSFLFFFKNNKNYNIFIRPYCVFIELQLEADFIQLLEELKPENLYAYFGVRFPLGFYDERTYGQIYIRLSDFTFITVGHAVVLNTPSSYKPRGLLDIIPYILVEEEQKSPDDHSAIYKRNV